MDVAGRWGNNHGDWLRVHYQMSACVDSGGAVYAVTWHWEGVDLRVTNEWINWNSVLEERVFSGWSSINDTLMEVMTLKYWSSFNIYVVQGVDWGEKIKKEVVGYV